MALLPSGKPPQEPSQTTGNSRVHEPLLTNVSYKHSLSSQGNFTGNFPQVLLCLITQI